MWKALYQNTIFELCIGIRSSLSGMALSAFWKRALQISTFSNEKHDYCCLEKILNLRANNVATILLLLLLCQLSRTSGHFLNVWSCTKPIGMRADLGVGSTAWPLCIVYIWIRCQLVYTQVTSGPGALNSELGRTNMAAGTTFLCLQHYLFNAPFKAREQLTHSCLLQCSF